MLLMAAAAGLASCSAVYEDLDACPQGADIVLSYSQNLLGADAYSSAVHCADLHLYNDAGNYIGSYPVNGNRLSLDLAPGNYHAIVYGGMGCEDASFAYNDAMEGEHHYNQLTTNLTGRRGFATPAETFDKLHPQFHAAGDFTVEATDTERRVTNLDMAKNTNNIRIVLQHSDGSSIDVNKFKFYITADNSTMDHANNVVRQGSDVTYRPWIKDTMMAGFMTDGTPVETAFAEITTARLSDDYSDVLHVELQDGTSVINTPIAKYLELIKKYELADVPLQEYLNRQDSWTLLFMLNPVTELPFGIQLKVNDWVVVMNEFEF